jgi:hypothetical protein
MKSNSSRAGIRPSSGGCSRTRCFAPRWSKGYGARRLHRPCTETLDEIRDRSYSVPGGAGNSLHRHALGLEPRATLSENTTELQARYYDWCSARIAERLVQLSPEEIWHRAAVLSEARELFVWEEEIGGKAFPPGNAFFSARLLAHIFAQELDLPPFEQWEAAYRANPEKFDREIVMVDATSRQAQGT